MSDSALNPSSTLDSPALWSAGGPMLSLGLMDARNHTLSLLARFEAAAEAAETGRGPALAPDAGAPTPLWLAGHAAWFAEYWIGRNTRRSLGVLCPPDPLRLPSLDASADRLWDPAWRRASPAAQATLPEPAAVRSWMLDTLESTLELLDRLPADDASLYFFRLALFREDLIGAQLVQLAQHQGVRLDLPWPEPMSPREPLSLPATRWTLSQRVAAFSPEGPPGELTLALPEFEIDAQPVSWAQYIEFVDDGGYERPECWQPEGWAWLQAQPPARRQAPRQVLSLGVARQGGSGAVLLQRFGQSIRLSGLHPVTQLSWWEADAWCRWAGRRLPDEAEWDLAARTLSRRGFRHGGVVEWTASRLHPWPGARSGPWADYAWPLMGQARVRRGHSPAHRARLSDPAWRWFALPGDDADFVGFRSCAL
ncbi:SUMF1/EgtB/PvdO family nonheme iron enzyme [Curvibacter sp. HBC61]|uniref:SUMF1/EgtB/PvdO family nonheme iron enzyme n=1 Tax=Curvibacter cyanobacteriorum TaxID=3026422 RepID=A0ABT5N6L9_9BURK|nr:SUMF1/EgtB/PvdO family nonheme iron enzyme [Curvibacter sp. HBC61]MDD0840772.1 SUMF1/EgtB/PvdO family nonheme iron enzyme [Curvibacter sp. HBC61]